MHWNKPAPTAYRPEAALLQPFNLRANRFPETAPMIGRTSEKAGASRPKPLTRFGKKPLDDDNLRSCFKAARDSIARMYGVDDGGSDIKWEYDQKPDSKCKQVGVGISIVTRNPIPGAAGGE